jgi:hypothetical protein
VDRSQLSSVFEELPRATLEDDPGVSFVLDGELRLLYCNPAWDQFAVQDEEPHLCADHMLGKPVLEGTSGELFDYYRALYGEALRDRKPRDHDFHCSSPSLERLMRMHVYPLRNTAALLITCSTRVQRPHSTSSEEPIEGVYRNHHGVVVMCSNCRRTRRADKHPETWDWVSDFVMHQPARVSHGLCNLCLDYYYPANG